MTEDKEVGHARGRTHWYNANSLCNQRTLKLISECSI